MGGNGANALKIWEEDACEWNGGMCRLCMFCDKSGLRISDGYNRPHRYPDVNAMNLNLTNHGEYRNYITTVASSGH